MDNFIRREMFEPLENDDQKSKKKTQADLSFWGDSWRKLKQNKLAVASLFAIGILVVLAIIGPYLNSYTYDQQNLQLKNTSPNGTYWFGSDAFGRDLFTRIWYGARISLFIGISAAIIDLIIGALWGGIAGYYGGKVDEVMMRICDILNGLPHMLIVVLLLVVMGPGLFTIIIAMTITGWIGMARIVRGEVLRLKEQEFILATKSMGASSIRILLKHLIPNSLGPIIVVLTLTIPTAIFTEAFLSFIGLGVQAPMASWGVMTNDGFSAFHYYPWQLFFPAIFICITMLAFNILGDGLRDAFDPRMRK